jgi:DNA-binding response OmpR family regulator
MIILEHMKGRPRVLLIDDDTSFLMAMALGLRDTYAVSTVSDAREVDKHLGTADVIVCDYRMQFLNGHDVIRRVKDLHLRIPVILVSAYATKQVVLTAAQLRAFNIFEKPVTLEQLSSAIGEAVQSHCGCRQDHSLGDDISTHSPTLTVTTGALSIRLTLTEFKLLEIFLTSPNEPIHRDVLHQKVWGDCITSPNILETHLGNLKKKIPLFGQRFRLVRGRGYIYEK